MAQTEENIRTINLEFIGAGEVTVDEASEAAAKIYNEIKNLGNNGSNKGAVDTQQPEGPSFNTGKLKTYGMYIGGGLVAVYLIGKALE